MSAAEFTAAMKAVEEFLLLSRDSMIDKMAEFTRAVAVAKECEGDAQRDEDGDIISGTVGHAYRLENQAERIEVLSREVAQLRENDRAHQARANGDAEWITAICDELGMGKTARMRSRASVVSRIQKLKEDARQGLDEANALTGQLGQVYSFLNLNKTAGITGVMEKLTAFQGRAFSDAKADVLASTPRDLNRALHRAEVAEGAVRELRTRVDNLEKQLDPTTVDQLIQLQTDLDAARRGGDRRLGGQANASESRRVRINALEADNVNLRRQCHEQANQLAVMHHSIQREQRRECDQKITNQRNELRKLNQHVAGLATLVEQQRADMTRIYEALGMQEGAWPQNLETAIPIIEELRRTASRAGSYQAGREQYTGRGVRLDSNGLPLNVPPFYEAAKPSESDSEDKGMTMAGIPSGPGIPVSFGGKIIGYASVDPATGVMRVPGADIHPLAAQVNQASLLERLRREWVAIDPDLIWSAIAAERFRAHQLHLSDSMESNRWDDPTGKRARVLGEEFGEVLKCFNDRDHALTQFPSNFGENNEQRAEIYAQFRSNLRKELIQTAAMAGAWAAVVPQS